MPFGDRTGPRGVGPMTGRGAGYCAGFGMPGFANLVPGRGRFGFGLGSGWGSPYGYPYPIRSWWGGRGRGRGRGRGWRWFAPYWYP